MQLLASLLLTGVSITAIVFTVVTTVVAVIRRLVVLMLIVAAVMVIRYRAGILAVVIAVTVGGWCGLYCRLLD